MGMIIKRLLLLSAAVVVSGCAGAKVETGMRDAPPSPVEATSYPGIVIYTVSWCPHCQAARRYLDERNIPYTNRDVEQDAQAMDTLVNRYGSQSVPVIVIGNDEAILKGFSPESFNKALQDVRKP